MYVCMYVCIYVYMYVCMYVYMYMYVCIDSLVVPSLFFLIVLGSLVIDFLDSL